MSSRPSSKELNAKGDHIYFPFATNPKDLAGRLGKNGKCRDIAPELRPFLTALTPYPSGVGYQGGNDALAWLSSISGPNKHRMAISIAPGIESPTGDFWADKVENLYRWDQARRELTIGEFPSGTAYAFDIKIPMNICFSAAPTELQDFPVESLLGQVADIVERIVLGLEAETARILKERGGP